MIIFSFSKSALVHRFVSVWFTFAVWAARVHIPFSKRESLTTDGKLPRNSGTLVRASYTILLGDRTLLLLVISKETVVNSWDILYSILGHKYHQNHPNSHTQQINPKFATESEFYHICVLQCAYAPFRHLI